MRRASCVSGLRFLRDDSLQVAVFVIEHHKLFRPLPFTRLRSGDSAFFSSLDQACVTLFALLNGDNIRTPLGLCMTSKLTPVLLRRAVCLALIT
jgi:hypothetical protein